MIKHRAFSNFQSLVISFLLVAIPVEAVKPKKNLNPNAPSATDSVAKNPPLRKRAYSESDIGRSEVNTPFKKAPTPPLEENDEGPAVQPVAETSVVLMPEPTPFEKKIMEISYFPEVFKLINELYTLKLGGNRASSDYQVRMKLLDILLALPWSKKDEENFDLNMAQYILDQDHYGLEKVKKRIIEHLAIQKRLGGSKGAIICLVGPPGVGKTTLAASIAKAVGRKFVNAAFGGSHDEASIRGHAPSYVAAAPGKIIQAMMKAGVVNPVILLDEIDKLGNSINNGNPAAALLEVLDPNQNKEFKDNFLGIPYDLSQVMFILSANSDETIPAPLLDRMEVIKLYSYTPNEKFEIAQRHLISKVFRENGVLPGELVITEDVIRDLIRAYTSEAGVRKLSEKIAGISRYAVTHNMMNEPQNFLVASENLVEILGQPHDTKDKPLDVDTVGHTQGLSVSTAGGRILPVEVSVKPGRGKIITTGNLKNVMKESACAAMTVVYNRLEKFDMTAKDIRRKDFHIHFPAAAIPKDGPSAGLAMATTLMSAITNRPVDRFVCMTGEIGLHGQALPIGGLREKLTAAHRAGMQIAIIPEGNIIDLVEVPDEVRQELEIIAVNNIDEVFKIALK